jgi:hypothetical protein
MLHDWSTSTATLCHPGTVVIGRTHVDVLLDLEDVDLAARIAGLDRDPGWVPMLGRVVAFHFEGGATSTVEVHR